MSFATDTQIAAKKTIIVESNVVDAAKPTKARTNEGGRDFM